MVAGLALLGVPGGGIGGEGGSIMALSTFCTSAWNEYLASQSERSSVGKGANDAGGSDSTYTY